MEHYQLVPRPIKENLEYRLKLRDRCARDERFKKATMQICKEDVLFWMSAFCWIYEPRPKIVDGRKLPNIIPFIPWDHQIPIIKELKAHLGYEDVGLEKSRGEGMSWIAVLMALHDWVFVPMSKIGLVSRNLDMADNPEDPDSLGWKVRWEIDKLPKWMVGTIDKDWTRNVSRHAFVNLRNGAAITAHSATENVGRGGRYSWFLMDELASFPRGPDYKAVASTQHATNSRLYVSTPEGSEGAYFEIMHTPSNLKKLRLHWSMNPTKNRGLYKIVKGQVVVQDPENNPLPPDYQEKNRSLYSRLRTKGYNLEKGWRSPWYDKECDRPGATPQFIAQELDLDYAGSKHLVFGNDFVAVAEETVRPPLIKGTIGVHPETLEVDFERSWEGTTDLWIELDHRNRPPAGNYVIGCDISSGLGGSYTSNSVLEIFDLNTKEQVLEFATNIVQPQDFADIAIGVARWFWDAYLAWEIGGPGHAFTGRVMKNGYGNVYYRTVLWKSTRSKKHKEVGWQTDAKSKQLLIADLITQIKNRELVLRSKKLLDETRQYIMHQGEIKNAIERTTQDDSSKGASHGDRVIALGVAVQAAKDRPSESLNTEQDWTKDPPENTVAYRYKEYLRSKEDTSDGWVDRTNGASTTAGSSLTVGRHDWGD